MTDLRHQTSDLRLGSQKSEVGSQNNTPYRKQDSCLSNRRMRQLQLISATTAAGRNQSWEAGAPSGDDS